MIAPARMGDLIALARACLPHPPARRVWVARRILCEAAQALAWRQGTGQCHPRWGDGTIMAAALRRAVPGEPGLDDAAYRSCLILGLRLLGGEYALAAVPLGGPAR